MGKGDVLKNVPFPHAPIPQNFETGAVISTVLFLYFYKGAQSTGRAHANLKQVVFLHIKLCHVERNEV